MAIATDPTIRRQVLVAARMILGERPRAPISEIARGAGVSRATLYRHFGSRRALLDAVAVEPPASAHERIVAAAAELVGPNGIGGLSMERLASAAGVSRATVYRLFPTKAALFAELLRTHSPFKEMAAIIERQDDDPPDVVLPAVARAIARIGPVRLGILRSLIVEASSESAPALDGARELLTTVVGRYLAYLQAQMVAGRLRRMQPVLAMQCVMGPVVFHLLTRPVAERVLGLAISIEDAAEELTRGALHGLLQPERGVAP